MGFCFAFFLNATSVVANSTMKSIVFIACACALIAIAIAVPIKMHEVEPAALTDTMINHINSKQREWVAGHNKHFEGKTIQWVKVSEW